MREVDKTLTELARYDESIRFKESGSMFNLELVLSYSDVIRKYTHELNYLYIKKFKRYYYIRDIILVPEGVKLICEVDVLMSFKDGIRDCKAFILRQENRKNYDIIDSKLIYDQKHKISYKVVSGSPFSRAHISNIGSCITLTVNGGL